MHNIVNMGINIMAGVITTVVAAPHALRSRAKCSLWLDAHRYMGVGVDIGVCAGDVRNKMSSSL